MLKSKRLLIILGHLFFVALFILSLLFFKERQSYDAAHYLFELINSKTFFVAHLRPIAIVSQVLPLIGIWINVSMKNLMILYSIGDILYYYSLFIFAIYFLKDSYCGLAIILTICIAVTYSFYCPVTELLQGLAFLPILNSLLYRSFLMKKIIIAMLLAVLVFSHPLMFYPLAIILFYWLLKQENVKATFFTWASFIIICVLKFTLLDKYDQQKTFYPVVFNDYGQFKNLTDSNYLLNFIEMFIRDLKGLVILFLLTLIIIWNEKKVVIPYLSSILFFLIIILCTHRFEVVTNYSERMLLPLTSLVVIPFAYGLEKLKNRGLIFSSLSICFLLSGIHIQKLVVAANPYTLRIKQLENLCSTSRALGLQKVVAKVDNLEQVPFANTGWCTSIESTLFSSLNGADSCVSIAMQEEHIDRIKEQGSILDSNSWIKWTEIILDQSTLNKNYFSFKKELYTSLNDTNPDSLTFTHSYQIIIDKNIIDFNRELKFFHINLIANGGRIKSNNLEYQLNFYKNNVCDSSLTCHYKLESDFISNVQQLLPVSQNALNNADKVEMILSDNRSKKFALCKSEMLLHQ